MKKAIISITILFSLSVSSCSTLGIKNKAGLDSSKNLTPVEKEIEFAKTSYNLCKYAQSRVHCDEALKELIKNKEKFTEREYERLHGEIALLRLKTNQTEVPEISTIKSDLFPLVWNSRVEKWINYYTGRGRQDMIKAIERSKPFIKKIKRILSKEEKVPNDLAYVPIVESAYYPFARSRAGAVGIWQFMKTTAKLNGLKTNDYIDEKRDPYKSTKAAVKVLKKLHSEFGSWELALAGYNYGPNGVRRRIKKWKTDDYWELYLPRETENFVPKIMAVIYITREPELFGFKKFYEDEEESEYYKSFTVENSVDLRTIAKLAKTELRNIQLLNPELKNLCTPPNKKYHLRIPSEKYEIFVKRFNGEKNVYLTKEEVERLLRKVVYYSVRSGDNLWNIAKRYKVTVKQLKSWNNLKSNVIRPRQKLKIAPYNTTAKKNHTYYTVKSGDSLWKIAKKFKVTPKKIKKWNNLKNNRIYPKQKLKIYKHGA